MDNFKAVYKILSALEASMDLPRVNPDMISAETLGVSEERWIKYIEMMADVGYIKGVTVQRYINGAASVSIDDIQITLKGLEYLQENSVMKQVYKYMKGIKEITPGI